MAVGLLENLGLSGDERLVVDVAAASPAGAHPYELACCISGVGDRHLSVRAVQVAVEAHRELIAQLRAERGAAVSAALQGRAGALLAGRAGGVQQLEGVEL